ncbi:MAG TPA: hypothetical protein VIY09_03180 [Rhizomicrobium sp.]
MRVQVSTIVAIAALLAAGATAVCARPASADLFKTSCYKRDCVRVECDDRGASCFRLGYFARDSYDLSAPYCYHENYGAPSGGIGPGGVGCGSGPAPHYHYLNRFDQDDDFNESGYPG